jgi:hypothetical protein
MKIIIPTEVDDTIFVSTNVDEEIPSSLGEWNSGVTYDKGDFVYVIVDPDTAGDGTEFSIYESLQGTNLNKDPETETDWWVFRSTTYAEYDAGETYDEGDIVIDASTHIKYESLQAANTGNAPASSPTWWLSLGATNSWAVFDEKVGTQTERTNSIYYELEPGLIEGIAFFNLEANSIRVQYFDSTEYSSRIAEDSDYRITESSDYRIPETAIAVETYSETIELINTDNVFDGYSYCFAPILTTKNTAITDLPPYSGASTLLITIDAGGDDETAKCGEIVFGRIREFGSTQYNAGFEIIDYSRKTVDDFGNFSVTERAFSKRVPMDVILSNQLLSYLKQTLEEYRATPVVCIPTEVEDLVGPFLLYGYYRTARVVVSYPSYSVLTIEWEGLT